MSNVVSLNSQEVYAGIKLDPDTILENNKGRFTSVIIIGETIDGEIEICSTDAIAETVLMLELAKRNLMGGM